MKKPFFNFVILSVLRFLGGRKREVRKSFFMDCLPNYERGKIILLRRENAETQNCYSLLRLLKQQIEIYEKSESENLICFSLSDFLFLIRR